MAPPLSVEERNPAPLPPAEQRSPGPRATAPKPMMNILGGKPTPFAMALRETSSTLQQKKTGWWTMWLEVSRKLWFHTVVLKFLPFLPFGHFYPFTLWWRMRMEIS